MRHQYLEWQLLEIRDMMFWNFKLGIAKGEGG